MAEKRRLTIKSLFDRIVDRPKPSAPRAGFKASGSRYDKGGKLKGKKTV